MNYHWEVILGGMGKKGRKIATSNAHHAIVVVISAPSVGRPGWGQKWKILGPSKEAPTTGAAEGAGADESGSILLS
jgi:hypothetical protein